MAKKVNDTWENIHEAYVAYRNFDCHPDISKFPKAHFGQVIDEEKSVRWNREEIERRKKNYDNEVARLNTLKNKQGIEVRERAIALVMSDAKVSKEKATAIWDYAINTFDNVYDEIPNFLNVIKTVLAKD